MRDPRSAIKLVELSIKRGELIRAERCETCNKKPTDHIAHAIVAHHFNGYDDPLNIWWICRSCNRFLAGKHDGSLNLQQAKAYVRQKQLEALGYYQAVDKVPA